MKEEPGAHHPGEPELPGLARACRVLAAGGAVVIPNPAPMTSGVVATRAEAVNALKGRRLDQNVAVSLHDALQWQHLVPSIDLPPAALDAVVAMLRRRLTVLVPLRDQLPHPEWVTPAVRDGYLAAFNGYWAATALLWDSFPRLYGSSANLTGKPPATSAAQAMAIFGADRAVGDPTVDPAVDPPGPRSPSTMVRIHPSGRLQLYRAGAQDAALGLAPGEFLRHLASTVGLPDQTAAVEGKA